MISTFAYLPLYEKSEAPLGVDFSRVFEDSEINDNAVAAMAVTVGCGLGFANRLAMRRDRSEALGEFSLKVAHFGKDAENLAKVIGRQHEHADRKQRNDDGKAGDVHWLVPFCGGYYTINNFTMGKIFPANNNQKDNIR